MQDDNKPVRILTGFVLEITFYELKTIHGMHTGRKGFTPPSVRSAASLIDDGLAVPECRTA